MLAGAATTLLGVAGIALGSASMFGTVAPVHLGWLVPLVGVELSFAPLAGLIMAVTGAVAIPVGIYSVGYSRREHLPVFASAVLPVFVAAMLLVPSAGSVSTFLLAWELMALASLLLVLTEHRRDAVRDAGLMYAALTQLGFMAILLGLLVLSASAGADTFSALAANIDRVSPGTRALVFVLTLIGFGSKAGLVPLHAWLPSAHPEAPSPVSALMSAAMVNMGIYGIVRFDLQLLGPGPRSWGLVLLIVGGVSAVYGALQASVATDLKRLLAYSTTENMGLIALALGAATLLAAAGAHDVATIAMTAALLHLVCHAAFKTLAFLAAGSVLAGTGLRDLDEMGGLARRMPVTTVAFGVAALGACALPLGAGFVSEWLLVQSLIHAPRDGTTLLALALPLAVGVVALTTGLVVVAMVKAFGVGFLARPRSAGARDAREASGGMQVAMGLAAAACAVLAVAPVVVGPALRRVLEGLPAVQEAGAGGSPRLATVLRLPGVAGTIAPLWLAVGLVVACVVAVTLSRWGSRRRPAAITSPLWACGADALTSRMQYTATSFGGPLQRVFDDVLRPDTDIEISHYAESRYLVEKVGYQARVGDAFEQRVYRPVVSVIQGFAALVRRAHPGGVHVYLAYGALGLLVVLVISR